VPIGLGLSLRPEVHGYLRVVITHLKNIPDLLPTYTTRYPSDFIFGDTDVLQFTSRVTAYEHILHPAIARLDVTAKRAASDDDRTIKSGTAILIPE
jgi:hypothetical protein